jgi:hypothetical protein
MREWILLFILMAGLGGYAVEHRFLCVDNGANRLIHVDQLNRGRDWSVALPKGARDMQLVDDDVVLVSHGSGAGEYSLKDGRLLKVVADGYKNINSLRRLPDGGTMLVSRSGDVYLLDKSGRQIKTFRIRHDALDLRLARFNAAGNLMVVQTGEPRCLIEAGMDGKVLRTVPVSGKGYRAHELKSGNILISVGDSVKVIEVDPKGEVVRFVGGKDKHAGLGLDFFSGFDVLANGNIVAANWLGHGRQGTAPHLFEFDAENNVVWSWEDHKAAKQVTNVLVIE